MRVTPIAFAVLLSWMSMLGLGPSAGAAPLKIRVGWANTPSSLTPVLFAKQGVAKHVGESYELEPVRYQGTAPEITALATGDLDIATLAFSSLGAAIENAHLEDLRIIADGFQDGVDGYYSSEYMVRKDSPINTVEDLIGKVLVSNAFGGAVDMGMRNMLKKHHMADKKDVTIIEAAFPAMIPMLEEHKVDLIAAVPPFAQVVKAKGIGRVLFTLKEAAGPTEMIFWVARRSFLEKNRAALYDFIEDSIRALQWYIDPANHEEAVRIVSNYTKLPPKTFERWLFTKADYYRDPWGVPNLDALQQNIKTQRELGFLKQDIDVRKYADLSFVEEAARRIKK